MVPKNNASGGPILSERSYPIAKATEVSVGQVVKLSVGKVVPVTASDTSAILGIAAETHTGAEDALNPRSNGEEIMVYDGPDLVFSCKAPTITVKSGTATTIVADSDGGIAAFAADDFNGGLLQLVSLAASSTNTDVVGQIRKVSDFADASGTETFTVDSAGTAAAGDVYRVYPPIGFAKGGYDSKACRYVLSGAASLGVKVVGWDKEHGLLLMMAKKHSLGNDE